MNPPLYKVIVHEGCGGQVQPEGDYDGILYVCQKCGKDDYRSGRDGLPEFRTSEIGVVPIRVDR